MPDYDDREEQVRTIKRRLQLLKEQRAVYGFLATPPHIIMEIENLEKELQELENYQGNQIIKLLADLDPEALLENVQSLYETARGKITAAPDEAIRQCNQALGWLKENTEPDVPSNRARFYILLGIIYLNPKKKNPFLAVDYFRKSGDQFRKRKSYLESVAELGLALAQDEMGNLGAAIGSLDRAKRIAYREATIPDRVNDTALENLRRIIKEQNAKILQKIQAKETGPKIQLEETEKALPIFTISSSVDCIGRGGTTDLNLLSFEDYQRHHFRSSENVVVDRRKRRGFSRADYILEIDEEVDQVNDGLSKGDWLLIESTEDPQKLQDNLVAVLIRHNSETGPKTTSAGLKTFSSAGDHYFLNSQGKSKSILITHYRSGDVDKIKAYYQGHTETEEELAFDVRIAGKVVDQIPKRSAEKIRPTYIWDVPIIAELPDDTSPIAEEDIIDTIPVKRGERRKGCNCFGLKDENEKVNRYKLIHQSAEIKNKDIAALVIELPGPQKKLKEFREYHLYDLGDYKGYYYLQAVKPSGQTLEVDSFGEHLVVVAEGTDINVVKDIYARVRPEGTLKFYEHAVVTIVGKYLETIEIEKD